MGRSDVRIITSKIGYEKLVKANEEFLKEKNILGKEDFNLMENLDVDKTTNCGNRYFGWNDLKWYKGTYDDVDAVMYGLSCLAEEGYWYEYIRLGEEMGNYEEHYNAPDKDFEEENFEEEWIDVIRGFNDDFNL